MSYNIKVDEKTKMCESPIIDLIKCYKMTVHTQVTYTKKQETTRVYLF